jgi:hypothetical protein
MALTHTQRLSLAPPLTAPTTHTTFYQVWHNYAFDRHVLYNRPPYAGGQRIDCRGFAGDTMHMARLWDTSMEKRAGEGGFSLEALSVKLLGGEESRKVGDGDGDGAGAGCECSMC